jgi:predicted O-methyltransferase YrrM
MSLKRHHAAENPLSAYLLDGYHKIEGWLMEPARDITLALADLQKEYVDSGPVLEIGVWKARYLCLLSFLPANAEKVIGLDPIVGVGNREAHIAALRQNIAMWSRRPDLVTLYEERSENVDPQKLLQMAGNKFQFISIDGSHLKEHVLVDLTIAEATLADGGIVAMDDIANPIAPGVWEAYIRYGMNGQALLKPIVNAGNKLFLTQRQYAQEYRENLLQRCEAGRVGKPGTRLVEHRNMMNHINQPMRLFGEEVLVAPGH